jgi:homoserine kinase type II
LPFDQVLRRYFANAKWEVKEGQSGWNNTTRFVESEGRRYVMRIYETHRDKDKVQFEHDLLLALSEQSLPFEVPVPQHCDDGSTIVEMTDGTQRLACLFAYIEGERPAEDDPTVVYSLGQAAAILSKALSGLTFKGNPIYPPYYEMDLSHPRCTADKVAAFCSEPPIVFQEEKVQLRAIGEAIERFRIFLPQFRALPHQLIHGDMNHSNSLVSEEEGNNITALLDFEFCTRDLRVMELAVIVSGLLSDDQPLAGIERLLTGFGEQLQLNRDEVEAIPLLVELRILDVFLHFLGRYWDGVDGEDVLREQTLSAFDGLLKLEKHSQVLSSLSLQYILLVAPYS